MSRWEYKTMALPFSKGWAEPKLDLPEFDGALNVLGGQGWELVSIFSTNVNGRSGMAVATFKREIAVVRASAV